MFKFKKSEKYYIKELLSTHKECWKSNMSEKDSWIELKKELKRMKLNSQEHPFLYDFREKSVYANSNEEIRNLLTELCDYKRYLNQVTK